MHMHVHVHLYINIHLYIHTCTHEHMCVYVIYIYIYTYIHTYIHIYIYTYIHIYMHVRITKKDIHTHSQGRKGQGHLAPRTSHESASSRSCIGRLRCGAHTHDVFLFTTTTKCVQSKLARPRVQINSYAHTPTQTEAHLAVKYSMRYPFSAISVSNCATPSCV